DRGDAGNSGGHRKSEGSSRTIEADANQAGMAGKRFRRRSKTMKVTRGVVSDLLPVYFSREGSGETKRLVEDYFHQDPDFERIARSAATPLETLQRPAPIAAGREKEKRDLESIRWGLRRRQWLFAGSLFLTLFPLSYYFTFTHGHLVSLAVRHTP